MLMQNLGAQDPIVEEDEEEYTPLKIDKNETDEDKKKRMEGKCSEHRSIKSPVFSFIKITWTFVWPKYEGSFIISKH